MTDINLVLAEELERLAAEYRAKAKNYTMNDQISIQDISMVLTEKIKKGKIAEIKALLRKYGAEKLIEVKLEDYADIFEDAKKI
ncbi:hypothetical protein [Caproiciproducens sp. MSJ-32]|uniref:hypothetical protein n=1 Tax=Caproiciproducens sp. MSJ-32 TaxID=2841527 RepID=UPI001C129419|nr:hypothetical protein [Caproiciproducens sp. MSJ-32]MBU5455285.1 hypothetical protein [Caproiciproducens sp. MSJ-32]